MDRNTIRNRLQKLIYSVINPLVRMLIRLGFTPNTVTITGLVLNIGVAVIFIVGGEEGNRGDLSYVGWAGALILFAGLFDMLDGQVARLGKMSSAYGALFDSVLDRYSELFMFLGICYYLVAHHYFFSSIIAFVALTGSMMVSYTRARAEALGIECKGGLMQRPERVVTVSLAAMACGITGHFIGGNYKLFVPGISFHIFEPMMVFTVPLSLLAILTNITALKRLTESGQKLKEREQASTDAKKQKTKSFSSPLLMLIAIGVSLAFTLPPAGSTIGHPATVSLAPPDSFPVPSGISNELFYLQRTHNSNTIVCALNTEKNGQPDPENPVHVFWIRYTEQGQPAELSFIQRTFAYGVKAKPIGNGNYELHFVSYKKYLLTLKRSVVDKKYHVYATIGQKEVILKRIFIKINGGSFWSPNVEYIEVKGSDPVDGHEVSERMKV